MYALPSYDSLPLFHQDVNGNFPDADLQYVPGGEFTPANGYDDDGEKHTGAVESRNGQAGAHSSCPGLDQQDMTAPGATEQNSRKRRASSVSEYDVAAPPQKKSSMAPVPVQEPNGDCYDFSGQTSPYSAYVPTPGSAGFPAQQAAVASPRAVGHQYSTSTASQVSLTAPSPHTPVWSPSFTTVKSEQSPRAPMTPVPRPASTSSPLKSSVPKLVRTSTIQQSPPGVGPGLAAGLPQSFNPYLMYPHLKANLKLKGDLDSMARDWSAEEREARRRLVEFTRCQKESTITAEFTPVAPQDRAPSSITISCIWWKEKDEYFVTSVDTIYLLEALVGVRFTVEEKNRIRRNLEGFRPLTVSKSKADSEEFFKVIMGFPHPKPRNIEKDVKVFPWKILAHALKKIISKYSASYSSTASALLTPAPSGYASVDVSAEYHYPPSPHPDFMATTAAPYPLVTTVAYSGGPMPGRMSGAPVTTGPISELPLQMPMPTAGPVYGMPVPYGYQPMPVVHASASMPPQAMSGPMVRMPASWEFAHYVNESPVTLTPPNSTPVTVYPRGSLDTRQFVPAVQYQ